MEPKRSATLTSRTAILSAIVMITVALLSTCSAADGLIGIHDALLPGFNQVPTPTVVAAATGIEVGASTTLTGSGSGAGAVYNWSIVSGGGTVDPAGDTVAFTASDTPETVTISAYASITGFQNSETVETDILVSDLPFLDAPTISFDEGTSTVFVGNSVNVTASGSGTGVTYNWTVTGSGSIGSTGPTVGYTAPAGEESATISVYATATDANDSPSTDATVTVKDNHFALLASTTTDSGTNINQPATLSWSTTAADSAYFDNSTPTQLEVLQAGDYFLALTIPMETTLQRSAVRAQVYVNGVANDGAVADSSYIRNGTPGVHDKSSDHLAILLDGLSANDTIEVRVTAAALAGTTVTITNQATLYAEYIEPSRTIFSATAVATTSGTNLNQATDFPLVWTQSVADSGFTHSGTQDITLDSAGYYLVYANLPTAMVTVSSSRFSIEMQVKLNSVTVDGGRARQGYIRNQNDHDSGSIHWSGLVYASSANQVLTVTARQEQSMTTAGTVDFGGNEATVFIERIDPGAFVYSGRALDPESGSDWNSVSELDLEWSVGDAVADSVTYGHSTSTQPDEITIEKAGDYLVIYNDALWYSVPPTGAEYRYNPRIRLSLDGTPVPGADALTHYLRHDATGNRRSSTSLVFYLRGVSAGQILTVGTQQEATASGTGIVMPESAADTGLLTVIRKK
jgi:hypothetical protein